MNYIHTLKREKAVDKAELLDLYASLDFFRLRLQSEKYTGHQADGSRKDWISTADVFNWIQDVKKSAQTAGDDAAREFDRIQAAKPTLRKH